MCRRKESKGGVGDEKKKKGKVTSVLPHIAQQRPRLVFPFFSRLSLWHRPLFLLH